MSVKERLIEYLKYKKIGQKRFAQSIGMSDGYVNAIRQSIQPNTLNKISEKYPDLNMSWLLFGDGEMLNRENEAEKILNELSDNVLQYLKAKTANITDTDLKSMNVSDLLILQMLERIKKLEVTVERLEREIKEIKKGR